MIGRESLILCGVKCLLLSLYLSLFPSFKRISERHLVSEPQKTEEKTLGVELEMTSYVHTVWKTCWTLA